MSDYTGKSLYVQTRFRVAAKRSRDEKDLPRPMPEHSTYLLQVICRCKFEDHQKLDNMHLFNPRCLEALEETYASDLPLKTTGGATAAKTQKSMWSCGQKGRCQMNFQVTQLKTMQEMCH